MVMPCTIKNGVSYPCIAWYRYHFLSTILSHFMMSCTPISPSRIEVLSVLCFSSNTSPHSRESSTLMHWPCWKVHICTLELQYKLDSTPCLLRPPYTKQCLQLVAGIEEDYLLLEQIIAIKAFQRDAVSKSYLYRSAEVF